MRPLDIEYGNIKRLLSGGTTTTEVKFKAQTGACRKNFESLTENTDYKVVNLKTTKTDA
jgi:hypothetical protein